MKIEEKTPPTAKKRKKPSTIKYLTDEEVARLLRAIEAQRTILESKANPIRDLALFELAYHRGLRATEVGRIQISHLRLAVKRLYVTRIKGGNSGEFLLTDRECRALKPWTKQRAIIKANSGALFVSRNRQPISRRRLDELMKYYGTRAGLPPDKQHFHCLRHSCATALLDRDVSIEEVQDHLGHADIRNTMIYAKITNAKRQRKDEKLQSTW